MRCRTIDGTAEEYDDFNPVDEIVNFKRGQAEKTIKVKIFANEGYKPLQNFFMQLYDSKSGENLVGSDTKTTITIIDDEELESMLENEDFGFKQM